MKRCSKCDKTKEEQEFEADRKKCRKCRNEEMMARAYASKELFISGLLNNARASARERLQKGRTEAGVFVITKKDLMNLLMHQNGKCYYSGVALNLRRNSDWQCSLERVDPSRGYDMKNIALIALEFQNRSQWNKIKYQEFISLICAEQVPQTIDWSQSTRKDINCRYVPVTIEDTVCYQCRFCNVTHPEDNFLRSLSLGCTSCRAENKKKYKLTPRGHLSHLIEQMIANSKKRGHHKPSLKLQDLINLWENQAGLCHYSGIPMTFGYYLSQNWICSVERLNISKGYDLGNICLVCLEFNTADYSFNQKKQSEYHTGSSAWSAKKIQTIRQLATTDTL